MNTQTTDFMYAERGGLLKSSQSNQEENNFLFFFLQVLKKTWEMLCQVCWPAWWICWIAACIFHNSKSFSSWWGLELFSNAIYKEKFISSLKVDTLKPW